MLASPVRSVMVLSRLLKNRCLPLSLRALVRRVSAPPVAPIARIGVDASQSRRWMEGGAENEQEEATRARFKSPSRNGISIAQNVST